MQTRTRYASYNIAIKLDMFSHDSATELEPDVLSYNNTCKLESDVISHNSAIDIAVLSKDNNMNIRLKLRWYYQEPRIRLQWQYCLCQIEKHQ